MHLGYNSKGSANILDRSSTPTSSPRNYSGDLSISTSDNDFVRRSFRSLPNASVLPLPNVSVSSVRSIALDDVPRRSFHSLPNSVVSSRRESDIKNSRVALTGSVADMAISLQSSILVRNGLKARRKLRILLSVMLAARFFLSGARYSSFDKTSLMQRGNILAARGGKARIVRMEVKSEEATPCLPFFGPSPLRSSAQSSVCKVCKGPSRITPYLYIGDKLDADNLPLLLHLNITHILNMANNTPPPKHADLFVYVHLPISDSENQSIGPVLPRALSLIRDAHESGGCVLVHCAQGISRSVTLAAAYLISKDGPRMHLDTVMRRISAARPQAKPNTNFAVQLAHFEYDQQGVSSIANLDIADEMWDKPDWRKSSARKQALVEMEEAYRSGRGFKKALDGWFVWIKVKFGLGPVARVGAAPLT